MIRVAVVGLGAVGAQVLWQLSQKIGVEAHGFEMAYPGHPYAASGGESRIFRRLDMRDLGYMPIHQRADELFDQLSNDDGRQLRKLNGVLNIAQDGSEYATNLISSAKQWGCEFEALDANEVHRRYPQFALGDGDMGIVDIGGGSIWPEMTVAAAARQAVRHGASVQSNARVLRLQERNEGVQLELSDGSRRSFDRVVVAGGGWTTQLLPELRNRIVTRRLTSIWYAGLDANSLVGMPPFLQAAPGYCYGLPSPDGRSVKVGLGFNDHMPTGNPDHLQRMLTLQERRREIEHFSWILKELLPVLAPDPLRIDTYVESYSTTMHEYVGPVETSPNVIALTGFSGHGFEISPAMGEIGALLAVGEPTPSDIGFLDAAEPVFEVLDVEAGTTTHNPVMTSRNSKVD